MKLRFMDEAKKREVVLSMETAVNGGSLSLLENGVELDFWLGQSVVSKAEDVLEQIEILLDRNNIKKSLMLITASSGPGSSTGIKIGLSLAKGLSKAIGCRFVQMSVLESFLLKANINLSGPIITAFPIGKNLICRQVFKNPPPFSDESVLPQIFTTDDFIELLVKSDFPQAICHDDLFSLFLLSKKNLSHRTLFINTGINLAKLIAMKSITSPIRVR